MNTRSGYFRRSIGIILLSSMLGACAGIAAIHETWDRVNAAVTPEQKHEAWLDQQVELAQMGWMINDVNPQLSVKSAGIRLIRTGDHAAAIRVLRDGLVSLRQVHEAQIQEFRAAGVNESLIQQVRDGHDFVNAEIYGHMLYAAYLGGDHDEVEATVAALDSLMPSVRTALAQDRDDRSVSMEAIFGYLYSLAAAAAIEHREYDLAVEHMQTAASLTDYYRPEVDRVRREIQVRERAREDSIQQTLLAAGRVEGSGDHAGAMRLYLDALSSTGPQPDLLEGAIRLHRRMPNPPTVSEAARRHGAFAMVAVREAATRDDYLEALEDFGGAIAAAPWWADLYLNTALVLEQVEEYEGAIDMLQMYLIAEPSAADADQVQSKIYEFQYRLRN